MTDTNDPTPWQNRWREGRINFHQPQGNPLLRTYLPDLDLPSGARVFLPLCGKTGDIAWLLSQGHPVSGTELSPIAIDQLFDELSLTPSDTHGTLTRRSAPNLDVFVGDHFALTAQDLGPVDAIYDRAALVALPPEMRQRYAAHMATLAPGALQLLITFDYDQSAMDGPPFSVPGDEIAALYGAQYRIEQLADIPVQGGLKGSTPAREHVWKLTPR